MLGVFVLISVRAWATTTPSTSYFWRLARLRRVLHLCSLDPQTLGQSPTADEGTLTVPLLQNHVPMIIHPPMLYGGYVGMTPFALAMAALLAGNQAQTSCPGCGAGMIPWTPDRRDRLALVGARSSAGAATGTGIRSRTRRSSLVDGDGGAAPVLWSSAEAALHLVRYAHPQGPDHPRDLHDVASSTRCTALPRATSDRPSWCSSICFGRHRCARRPDDRSKASVAFVTQKPQAMFLLNNPLFVPPLWW